MSANNKTIKETVELILSVFFMRGGRSSFYNTTDTGAFKILLEKVGVTCLPTLKELLDQAQSQNPDK